MFRSIQSHDRSHITRVGTMFSALNILSQNLPASCDTPEPITTNEDPNFIVEDITKIINDTVDSVIGENTYESEKVNQWSLSVSEQCLNTLSKMKKPFKYVVQCSIMQKNGAGLHTASSCFWDDTTDGTCTVRWENENLYCIVTVFGLAI